MAGASVSKRYARALLDIGLERDSIESLREQLEGLARLFGDSHELRNALLNPSIRLAERKKIIDAIGERAGWDPMMRNFAMVLLDKDRFRHIESIAREYARMADVHAGIVRAKVTSATKLDFAQENKIRKALEDKTGKSVELTTEIDPSLIGGVVTRVGSMVLDGSVRTQFQQLRDAILQEV
jgi:F-type H+-transporting ATPase subunit delta